MTDCYFQHYELIAQHYIIIIYISNFHHFENVIKMPETGYDDLISNRCFVHGYRRQSVMAVFPANRRMKNWTA